MDWGDASVSVCEQEDLLLFPPEVHSKSQVLESKLAIAGWREVKTHPSLGLSRQAV